MEKHCKESRGIRDVPLRCSNYYLSLIHILNNTLHMHHFLLETEQIFVLYKLIIRMHVLIVNNKKLAVLGCQPQSYIVSSHFRVA